MSINIPHFSRNISKEIIGRYLPSHPIIVEAGAHIGRDTKKMAQAWPESTIHAFEPIPELYAELIKNTQQFPNIFCYNIALSSITGTITIYKSSGRSTATSSILEPELLTHPATEFTPLIVPAITLDDWAEQYTIPRVDCLWLDMQGAELEVLKSSTTMLKTISVLYTEVNFTPRYKNMPLYPELKNWLLSQGFHVEQEACPDLQWGNVLFIR